MIDLDLDKVIDKAVEFIFVTTLFATPVLIVDIWRKQGNVNDRLSRLQGSVNELKKDSE